MSDNALGQAAAEGDEDAFACLFERLLPAVFSTAWEVLLDRGAAAEVTYETFAAAWVYREGFRDERWAESLLESTYRRAEAWLVANPAPSPKPPRPDEAIPSPSLGPMLRNRIVTALAAHGVPTSRDESPSSGGEGRHLASSRTGRGDGAGEPGRLGALLAGSRARLAIGAAAATVVVVGAVGIGLLTTGESGASDGEVETGPPRPDDPPERTTVTTRRGPTEGSVASIATTTSTTASSTTTTTEPTTTTTQATTTSTTQAPSPTTTTTTTRPPSPAPRIVAFSGDFRHSDRCGYREELLAIRWTTENATTGRIRRDGGDWYPLGQQLSSGGIDVCARSGVRWYLEVSNSVGSTEASFVEHHR